jgi:hypothetical protein
MVTLGGSNVNRNKLYVALLVLAALIVAPLNVIVNFNNKVNIAEGAPIPPPVHPPVLVAEGAPIPPPVHPPVLVAASHPVHCLTERSAAFHCIRTLRTFFPARI